MARNGYWALGLFAILASRGAAQDFCLLLQEKGILTSEEVTSCLQAVRGANPGTGADDERTERTAGGSGKNLFLPANYKVGAGFLWESAENDRAGYGDSSHKPKFSLAVGNRLQVRYTFADRNEPGGSDSSAFRVRRFKFFLNGNAFYPWLRYKLQVDWVGDQGTAGNRPDLDDALVDVVYFPFLSIQAGQFKVPFNRQELNSSGALQFVDRAITNARFTLGRDQGVMVHGTLGAHERPWLEYAAGVFNGNGKNRLEKDNADHMGAARLHWTPLGPMKYNESDLEGSPTPRLGLGGAYAFNVLHGTTTAQAPKTALLPDPSDPTRTIPVQVGTVSTVTRQDAEYHRATADAHVQWQGASALAEYFFESRDDKTPQVTVTETIFGQLPSTMTSSGAKRGVAHTHGMNFQVGYFLLPRRVEVAARYAWVNPAGLQNRQDELRGAVSYFALGHALKVQADVGQVAVQRPAAADRRDLEFRTQLQVIF